MKTESPSTPPTVPPVPWNPWLGVIFIILVFFVSQFVGGLLVSIYPLLKHWSNVQANDWLNNSVAAQFVYIVLAESFILGAIYLFLKKFKLSWRLIGLGRRPQWRDLLYGLLAVPIYYVLLVVSISLVGHADHSFNVTQQQNIGFTSARGAAQLIMTFISLVVLPPLAEEIMVRGFLYSSLKKGLPTLSAALITSAIFASAHLPEGSGGLLWVAAVDTFVLSLVLIYLREKTGALWASMGLHAIKNGVAFMALFVLHLS